MTALFDRKSLLERIFFHLSTMESCLKWHTGRGHNDNAKILEDVVARFLSVLCGWELKNRNSIRANYPAGDLGDFGKRIAIQVTVDGSTKKVCDTHAKAIQHHLSQDFDTLIICFLLEKAPNDPRRSKDFTPCTSPKIEKWARPEINALLEARDNEDPDAHLSRLRRAARALGDEMSAVRNILSPALPYRPCNLPFASIGTHFKGRGTFLDSLHAALSGGDTVMAKAVVIRGNGGIGKTSAAVEYAWRHFLEYSALLLVTADSAQSLESGLAALGAVGVLSLPGHTDKKHPEQLAAVIRYLQTHPGWLLILDNADTSDAMLAVKDFLPRLTGGRIFTTTRRNTAISQFIPLDLDYLNKADSIDLLEEKTNGHRRPSNDDATALPELARLLDGLPLALTQAAAHIAWQRLSWHEYLALWQSNTTAALTWYSAEVMDYPRSLAVTYETSVTQLSPGAKQLLQVFAWFSPEPIPRLLMEMKGLPAEAGEYLAELERMSLVRPQKDATAFTLHRVLQEITRLPQIKTNDPPGALIAALDWLEEEFPFHSHDVGTWVVAESLVPHATTLAAHGDKYQIWRQTTCLQNRIGRFHTARAAFGIAEPLLRRALEISETTLGPVHPTLAKDLNNMALLLRDLNRPQEVEIMLRRALEMDQKVFGDDHLRLAIRQNNLASFLRDTGRNEEAELLFKSALKLFDKHEPGPSQDYALALRNLASFYHLTDRTVLALPLMRQAVEMARTTFGENHPEHAASLNNLAVMFTHPNQRDEALELLTKVARIEESTFGNKHPRFALSLNNIAMNYLAAKRFDEAESLMWKALLIDEAAYGTNHPDVARDLANLVIIFQQTGRLSEAEPLNRRAIEILIAFSVSTGHLHPHLSPTIQNYGYLLTELRDSEEQATEKIDRMLTALCKN